MAGTVAKLGSATGASTSRYIPALERIRATTQWLVAIFSGLGGVLIAGLSLASLGDTESNDFVWATIGIVAALSAITAAIFSLTRVLSPPYANLSNLLDNKKNFNRRDRRIFENVLRNIEGSAEELYKESATNLRNLYHRIITANDLSRLAIDSASISIEKKVPGKEKSEQGARVITPEEALRDLMSRWLATNVDDTEPALPAMTVLDIQTEAAARVVDFANYEHARLAFRSATRWLMAAAVITVTGVLVFVFFTTKPVSPDITTPFPVEVTFAESDSVVELLGSECDLSSVSGVAVAGTLSVPLVVTDEEDGCAAIRIEIDESVGVAVPQTDTTTE